MTYPPPEARAHRIRRTTMTTLTWLLTAWSLWFTTYTLWGALHGQSTLDRAAVAVVIGFMPTAAALTWTASPTHSIRGHWATVTAVVVSAATFTSLTWLDNTHLPVNDRIAFCGFLLLSAATGPFALVVNAAARRAAR